MRGRSIATFGQFFAAWIDNASPSVPPAPISPCRVVKVEATNRSIKIKDC